MVGAISAFFVIGLSAGHHFTVLGLFVAAVLWPVTLVGFLLSLLLFRYD